MGLIDGLCQVEIDRFKDCCKKGKIWSLFFDSIGKLKSAHFEELYEITDVWGDYQNCTFLLKQLSSLN